MTQDSVTKSPRYLQISRILTAGGRGRGGRGEDSGARRTEGGYRFQRLRSLGLWWIRESALEGQGSERAGSSRRAAAVTVSRARAPFPDPCSAGSSEPRAPACDLQLPRGSRVRPSRPHPARRCRIPLAFPVTVSGPMASDPSPLSRLPRAAVPRRLERGSPPRNRRELLRGGVRGGGSGISPP